MKYQITEENGIFYPQWSYNMLSQVHYFMNKSKDKVIYFTTFLDAENYIRVYDANRIVKTTEIRI